MKQGKELPIVSSDTTLSETLIEISTKGLGVALVVDKEKLKGIFTDGDLRRTLNEEEDPLRKQVSKIHDKRYKNNFQRLFGDRSIGNNAK